MLCVTVPIYIFVYTCLFALTLNSSRCADQTWLIDWPVPCSTSLRTYGAVETESRQTHPPPFNAFARGGWNNPWEILTTLCCWLVCTQHGYGASITGRYESGNFQIRYTCFLCHHLHHHHLLAHKTKVQNIEISGAQFTKYLTSCSKISVRSVASLT